MVLTAKFMWTDSLVCDIFEKNEKNLKEIIKKDFKNQKFCVIIYMSKSEKRKISEILREKSV